MLVASTAGLRSMFFQVRLEAGTRSFSENHSADSAGMENKTNHARRRRDRILLIDKFDGLVLHEILPSAWDGRPIDAR